ncbi:MAG: hypothetical protein MO853_10090 [Candidatus Protistobacter heckmanni]|nr:hypothetical protein [Candidatus Protistobacter heckmanni]
MIAGFVIEAACDLFHALAYAGMPELITENTTNKVVFFWFAGRITSLTTLFFVALPMRAAVDKRLCLLGAAAVIAAVFWGGTMHVHELPVFYQPGVGTTALKANIEYALAAGYGFTALLFLYFEKNRRDGRGYLLAAASALMGMGDLLLAGYRTSSDFNNIFAHVFKITGFALIYCTYFVYALRRPFERAVAAEAKLVEANDRLEQHVEERTRDLKAFSYSPAHDLRGPIGRINGFAHLLESSTKDRLTENERHFVERIQKSALSISELTDGMMELSLVLEGPVHI